MKSKPIENAQTETESMDLFDHCGAIVMPSRTIMLTGIPPELNNSETLHSYFSNFGALLWVNERYEQDPGTALITFFSIAEAISVFMSNEPILDVDSIQKSWFEYSKKCEMCSYKYTSSDSIKRHMEQFHPVKNDVFQIEDKNVNSKAILNVDANANLLVREPNQQPIAKNVEQKQNSATRELLRNRNEYIENEMTSLKRKNSDLNDALNKSVKQSDMERSEISILIDKLASMEAEKMNAVTNLKAKCKQLEEKDARLIEITARYETVQKEKLCMNHEFLTLKQKYEDLNDSYKRVLEQRNTARSEADKFRIERDSLKADQNSVEILLKEKYKQLEGKELELTRLLAGHELLLKEKERMENELNAYRDVAKEKEQMELEITSLKLKIDDLNTALRHSNDRQDVCESNSMVLNCNLQALLTENQKLIQDFKVECKRLEEMDQDFKRISVKYDMLLRQREKLDKMKAGEKRYAPVESRTLAPQMESNGRNMHQMKKNQ